MIKEKIFPRIVFLVLLAFCSVGWFFTILVDYFLLIVLGYFMTYFIYRYLVKVKFFWRLRRFYPLLFVISVLALWVGGALPYFNLMEPSAVYFNIVPQHFLGQTGNDFMWNGLILPLLGNNRIVPLELSPTYRYFLFNLVAILFWLGIPLVLGWSCLKGFAHALLNTTWRKLWKEWLKIILIGALSLLLMIGVARVLVAIYL